MKFCSRFTRAPLSGVKCEPWRSWRLWGSTRMQHAWNPRDAGLPATALSAELILPEPAARGKELACGLYYLRSASVFAQPATCFVASADYNMHRVSVLYVCVYLPSLSLAPSVCAQTHGGWLASSLWLWTITRLQSVIMCEHGCCFVIIFAEHSLCAGAGLLWS